MKPEEIPRQPLKTKGSVSAGFDPDSGVIVVEFHGGVTFAYTGCTQEQFDALLKADESPTQTVGAFVTANLMTHKFTKL